jgi:dihydrofolate reductase
MLSIVCALSENRVIGKEAQIPWHIKADLVHFRDLTLHHVVIMGRIAFDSMWEYYKKNSKPLPDRIHIVVTRDKNYNPDSLTGSDPNSIADESKTDKIHVVHSLEEAIGLAQPLCHSKTTFGGISSRESLECDEIFIAGGGQIYEQAIGLADKLYLTIVHQNFEGDAFFPDYSAFKKELSREEGSEGSFRFTFLELTK